MNEEILNKIMREVEIEAYNKNFIKDKNSLNFNERTFILAIKEIIKRNMNIELGCYC
jgi:hypothetical protein